MGKNEFLALVKKILIKYNFVKVKNSYYLDCNEEVFVVVCLQKSNYGEYYYIEYGFCVKALNEFMPYPKVHEADIRKRIIFNLNGNTPDQVSYESIDPDAFCDAMCKTIENEILPAIGNTKNYIAKNIERYFPVMKRNVADYLELKGNLDKITII